MKRVDDAQKCLETVAADWKAKMEVLHKDRADCDTKQLRLDRLLAHFEESEEQGRLQQAERHQEIIRLKNALESQRRAFEAELLEAAESSSREKKELLDQNRTRVAQLTDRIRVLEDEAAESQSMWEEERRKLLEEKEEALERIQQEEEQKSNLLAQLDEERAQSEEAKESVQEMQARLSQRDIEIATEQTQLKQVQARLEEEARELAIRESALQAQSVELEKERNTMNERFATLTSAEEGVNERLEDLKAKVSVDSETTVYICCFPIQKLWHYAPNDDDVLGSTMLYRSCR